MRKTFAFGALALLLTGLLAVPASAGDPIFAYDSNGNGSEPIILSGSNSFDPDGAIIDYQWRVNGVLISTGFGPVVRDVTHNFNLGASTVSLTVRDDAQVSNVDTSIVTILPQGTNQPPVANATVPGTVEASSAGVASVFVNAAASSDPEGDPIVRYRWTEGATVLYDGSSATATLTLNGVSVHTVRLTVYSRDSLSIIQNGFRDFTITVLSQGQLLANRRFTRTLGVDFSFSDTYGEYAAITFNALTRTYWLTDNRDDRLFEVSADGTLLRNLNIRDMKRSDTTAADVEGLAWIGGTTFALAMQEGEEIAIANITSTMTAVTRGDVRIYDASNQGSPKGLAYIPEDNSFVWVSRSEPKKVVKAILDDTEGDVNILWEKEGESLPASDLSDVAYFPRLSPHLLVVSESSRTVIEADVTGATMIFRSSFSLAGWDIPQASGLVFNHDGQMVIVGKRTSTADEDDFNVFTPTGPIQNFPPASRPQAPIVVSDSDGNGTEVVVVSDAGSFDPDGRIIDFQWRVNGALVASGFGPRVGDLTHTFALGTNNVTLTVRDDVQVSSVAATTVRVREQGSNLPPVANATVPGTVEASSANLAAVFVNAALSSDPEGDPIIRYRWTEGASVLYDGASATATLTLNGLGLHTIRLTVTSRDNELVLQSGFRDFGVTVVPNIEFLAGRQFNRTIGQDFSFSDTYGEYAAITFNALTRTYWLTDNRDDRLIEIQQDGTLLRDINIRDIKRFDVPEADAEGIAWMGGNTYALALQEAEEIAVVTLTSTMTALSRSNVQIYDASNQGSPKGLIYLPQDNSFVWVSRNEPKKVVKATLDNIEGDVNIVWEKEGESLPASDLSDLAYFPRLSPHLLVVSESSRTVIEADVTGATMVFKSSFSLEGWDIPQASGIVFNHDGEMVIVGKRTSTADEDDFNVFTPTGPIQNFPPNARIEGLLGWMDGDNDGFEDVLVSGFNSNDVDGVIIRYEWWVDGAIVAQGFGPRVGDLARRFPVGDTDVRLVVYDDAHVIGETVGTVRVSPPTSNLPPIADADVPPAVEANELEAAQFLVDASLSSDPEGDPIVRYRWTEGLASLYDGPSATATLTLQGLGVHTVGLQVFSVDAQQIVQSGSKTFQVAVLSGGEELAGRSFARSTGQDFFF